MVRRCIIVTILALTGSCAAEPAPGASTLVGAPPDTRILPSLPRSDTGLDPLWFLGEWRVDNTTCRLSLESGEASESSGYVIARDCPPPWRDAQYWRRPDAGGFLFEITTDQGQSIWRAQAIQPTAIAGVSSEGRLIRLYWAEEGVHRGWVQPKGESTP